MKNEQKKIRTSNYGVSIARQLDDGDIELLPTTEDHLKWANTYFGDIPEEIHLWNNIPLDAVFLYKVEYFDNVPFPNRKLIQAEIGAAKLLKSGKKQILRRLKTQKYYSEENKNKPSPSEGKIVNYPSTAYLLVTSYQPTSISDLFILEDTVICSLGNGRPELVPLEDGSVLGSINGDIRSATVQELFLATDLPLATNSSSFQLNGKNSLFLSNSLTLKSTRSRPPNPQPGTIVYNSRKKAFEGFNGEVWKTLKWED